MTVNHLVSRNNKVVFDCKLFNEDHYNSDDFVRWLVLTISKERIWFIFDFIL